MQASDRDAIEEVKADFLAVSDLIEGGFKGAADVIKRVNSYAKVYSAATRMRITDTAQQYAPCEELYRCYHQLLTLAVERHASRSTEHMSREQIFNYTIGRWNSFKLLKKWMLKTFGYLSRYYIDHCGKVPLEVVAMNVFHQRVYVPVAGQLRGAILQMIQKERKGDDVDKSALRIAIEIEIAMGSDANGETVLPNAEFIEALFNETAIYYKRESANKVAVLDTVAYMRQAEHWLKEESLRACRLLPEEVHPPFIDVVERQVLDGHQNALVNHPTCGILALLKCDRRQDIKLVCSLFVRRKHGLEPIAALLKTYCHEEGLAISHSLGGQLGASEPDAKQFCTKFIALQERYTQLVAQAFDSHSACSNAWRESFDAAINAGVTLQSAPSAVTGASTTTKVSAAELISNFVDSLLKGGAAALDGVPISSSPSGSIAASPVTSLPSAAAAGGGDDDLDALFNQIVSLVSRLSEKDTFFEFLRRQLSRRLLSGTLHEDHEKLFISKIKTKFGSSITSKLEHMINDCNVSQRLSQEFKQLVSSKSSGLENLPAFEFCASVLTSGVWPSFTHDQAVLPGSVSAMMAAFVKVYERDKAHRILEWMNSLGSVNIGGSFRGKEYSFHMSVFQALVLLLFDNDGPSERSYMSLGECQRRTNIEWEEVKRVVHSFCHSRIKLLCRHLADAAGGASAPPPTTPLKETDILTVNDAFSSNIKKIRVPLAVSKAGTAAAAAASVEAAVTEDRRPAIDACIVRIMKSRRQEEHTVLVQEVVQQLSARFPPDPRLIKQRIEELINRDYLERHQFKPGTYSYVA